MRHSQRYDFRGQGQGQEMTSVRSPDYFSTNILFYACILTTTTTATILRLSGFCPGQPGWASSRWNIHPLTPIMVISRPLSAFSI